MAHITKGRRWLLAIPVAGIIIGFLWLALEPIFGVLSLLWLPAVIAVGIGAAIWKWGATEVLSFLENKLARGLAIFALLLALYAYLGQLGYGGLDFFAGFMGVTKLVAAVILLTVALLLTPLPAVVITLFKPTGIPIDEKSVIQGSRGVAVIILTILLIRGVNVERWGEDIVLGVETAKAMVAAPAVATATSAPGVQEFRFNAGEEILTVLVGPGTYHKVLANKPFLLLSKEPDGSQLPFRFSAGWSTLVGQAPTGPARLKGLENGTVVRLESLK